MSYDSWFIFGPIERRRTQGQIRCAEQVEHVVACAEACGQMGSNSHARPASDNSLP